MDDVKVPIRGWLILIGIIVWVNPIDMIFVVSEILSQVVKVSWFELLLIIVQLVISIVVLILFVKRKRTFVSLIVILFGWSIIAGIASTLIHYTSISKMTYNIIVDIILMLYVLYSQRVKNTFVR